MVSLGWFLLLFFAKSTPMCIRWTDGAFQWNLESKINQKIEYFILWAGALVLWLWEETHVPKVVSSNRDTVYWMDIFSHLFVVQIVMCVWKRWKWMKKRPGLAHFFKKMFYFYLFNILLWRTPVFQETKATLMRSSLQRLQIGTRWRWRQPTVRRELRRPRGTRHEPTDRLTLDRRTWECFWML